MCVLVLTVFALSSPTLATDTSSCLRVFREQTSATVEVLVGMLSTWPMKGATLLYTCIVYVQLFTQACR